MIFRGAQTQYDSRPGTGKVHIKHTYLRLLRYAMPYKSQVVTVLLLSVVSAFVSVLPVQILGVAVDEINQVSTSRRGDRQVAPTSVAQDSGLKAQVSIPVAEPLHRVGQYISERWVPPPSRPSSEDGRVREGLITFSVLAAGFLLLQACSTGIVILHGFIMSGLGQKLIYDLRNKVYEHIQKLSPSYFEDNMTGDIMSRVINDVNALEQVIVGPVITFVTDVCRLSWVLYFCIRWDWQLSLIALTVGPLLVGTTYTVGKMIRRTYRTLRDNVGVLNALLQDNISGIKVIMGFAREEHELGRFSDQSKKNYNLSVKIHRMFTTFKPAVDFLAEVGSVIVLCYGGYKVLVGELTPGTFVIFFPYLRMLYEPITGLTRFYNQVQRAIASVERVFEVMDTEPELKDAPHAVELPRVKGRVEFKNVNFSYSNGIEVLKDINLCVSPGQMVAFVGPSGAGKTTITNLIPRFYDPASGSILIDGYNIKDVKIHSLRRQMTMVLQESFLFNNTVKVNIAYGKPDATGEEIIEAAKAANAHDFIIELPGGYDAVVGERGVKLSGGQKQRISIARAILADPRILILDEATSSVDSETEVLIQNAIYALVENRTTFVIAHRLSTILHADLIVVLDRGRIVEMGQHEELLVQGKLYARLFDMQFNVRGEPGKVTPASVEKVGTPLDPDYLYKDTQRPDEWG